MLQIERQDKILEYVSAKKSATVNKLAVITHSSQATVRRDLSFMERQGLIRRTHGGAILFESSNDETSSNVRINENKQQKEKIAMLTLPLLQNGRTLFFDASSTVLAVCKIFDLKYKTVITNGLLCALSLVEKETLNVIMPSGSLVYNSNSLIGASTIKTLDTFTPDIAVFSCGGVNGGRVMEATIEGAEIKKTVIAKAKTKILLVTSNKFNKTLPFETAKCDDFDYIITDCAPDFEQLEFVNNAKILY